MKIRSTHARSPRSRSLALGLLLLLGVSQGLGACQIPADGGPRVLNPRQGLNVPELKEHIRQELPVVVEHYALELHLIPETRGIEGVCTIRMSPRADEVRHVTLDLEGLDVVSVQDSAGEFLAFEHRSGKLRITLDGPLAGSSELKVTYGGEPSKGLWYVGDGTPTHCFTQGEPEDAHWWFPCIDDPSSRATSELLVRMPVGWAAVAAGERLERVETGNVATERWRMSFPHPPYLTTLVAGELVQVEEMWKGKPLIYMAEPKYADQLRSTFAVTPDVLDFLEDLTGLAYPYAKYSQACVGNFPFGGMENISATTLTSRIFLGERGLRDGTPTGLIAHEAAHQWFGDLLTCADWSHIVLNEGFATYAALLYRERTEGIDSFRTHMRDTQESYAEGDIGDKRRPVVHGTYRDPIDLFFGGQVYPGGASRLHLLRFVLGDEAFFDGVQIYVRNNAGRSVTVDDLQVAMETASGRDLKTFFEQWYYSAGFPEFEVRWGWNEIDETLTVAVDQVQSARNKTPFVFELPVDLEVRTRTGVAVHRVQIDERHEAFELACADKPEWVRFDKFGWIPKAMQSNKEPEEWLAIAAFDDDVNGRRDACVRLGELAAQTQVANKQLYVAQLGDRVRKDRSEAVRAAAALALGRAGGAEARGVLEVAATSDEAAAVRVACLRALGAGAPDRSLLALATESFETAYSWDTAAAAAGLVVSSDPEGALDWIRRQLSRESPQGVLQAKLLEEASRLKGRQVYELLIGWARDPAAPSRAREAAVAALGKHASGRPEVTVTLEGLLDSRNFRLRGAAIEAMAAIDDRETRDALRGYYPNSVFPRERRAIEAALGL